MKPTPPELQALASLQETNFWHDINRRVGMFRTFCSLRNAGPDSVPKREIVEQITQTREFLEAVDKRNLPLMKEILEKENCKILLQTTLNRIIRQFEIFG